MSAPARSRSAAAGGAAALPPEQAPLSTIQVPRRFVREEWGGTETTVLNCCRALLAAGNPTRIFTSMALATSRRESIQGVEVRRFGYVYPYWGLDADARDAMDRKGGNLLSLPLLWSLLREPGVALLHAHAGKRLGAAVRTAARLRGIPYVVTLHGGYFDIPQGQRQQLAEPYQGGIEWGKAAGALLGSRRVLEDAAAIICVGQNEWRAAREALPRSRVEWLPNGVDCAAFAAGDGDLFRRHFAIAPERRLVLCVSRIDSQKNQLALVDSLPGLLQTQPQAHLVLIGPVTVADYRRQLEQRIAERGLGGRVTLVPGLGADDPLLRSAYHAADVFCLPSLHEPFGIVILEAWAAGLPVVAARIGGIPSFTEHGADCLHIDPSDHGQLTAALAQVLADPALARGLAEAGRAKAQRDYDWSIIGARLLALYRDIVRHGKPA